MKAKINFVIDAIMFVLMGLLAGIGLLIKYVLVSGEQRWIQYGQNVDIAFWGMDRHEWGTIHLVVAIVLAVFLVLHIILHWNMIVCLYKRIIGHRFARIICAVTFVCISAILILFPYFIRVETQEIAPGRERFQITETRESKRGTTKQSVLREKGQEKVKVTAEVKEKEEERHHRIESGIEVKGFMTLAEVSREYNVPINYLKQALSLPATTSETAKLGHLRKQYGFKMSELEQIIINYKR
ncbi:MAG: DUF4405 domain-containing protein [Bacteroidales bacterium]|jgi:hypothetical protein|nr:DUF4405 domain-containing protein [Bacteroidales bacterium]